jgi:hypothetical protein
MRLVFKLGERDVEIAVTPAMVEAGVRALNAHASHEFRVLADEEIVERIV